METWTQPLKRKNSPSCESERMNLPAKSAPSGYHLATHKYMLAKCHGLIQGPTTQTRAMRIAKLEPVSSIDSEATEDYAEPTEPIKRKRKSKKPTKPKRSRTLITRSYFLRKDGKGRLLVLRRRKVGEQEVPLESLGVWYSAEGL